MKKSKIALGKKYHKLTPISEVKERYKGGALQWKFRCDCGREVIQRSSLVIRGICKSCRYCTRESLAGMRFGKLLVIKENERIFHGPTIWDCRCDCGNIVQRRGDLLKQSGLPNCGCSHPITPDLVGQKFGLLTVLGRSKSERSKGWVIWDCSCDCGGQKAVNTSCLRNGSVKSCGCLSKRKGDINPHWKGYANISGSLWRSFECGAKCRNIPFSISIEYVWSVYLDQNKCCALTGIPIGFAKRTEQTASLDRIDSSKGYIHGNIQWVHKRINWMKGNMIQEDFIQWCRAVASHNHDKEETILNVELRETIGVWPRLLRPCRIHK